VARDLYSCLRQQCEVLRACRLGFPIATQVFNTGVWPLSGIFEKNTQTHVALCGNFSGPVSATDLVKGSKDEASLLVHRFSKCSVWIPRAPREKPRGSASYSFTYSNTDLANFATVQRSNNGINKIYCGAP